MSETSRATLPGSMPHGIRSSSSRNAKLMSKLTTIAVLAARGVAPLPVQSQGHDGNQRRRKGAPSEGPQEGHQIAAVEGEKRC